MIKQCIGVLFLGAFLRGHDKLSKAKAAIVTSDGTALQAVLHKTDFLATELQELSGWAEDTLEERRLLPKSGIEDICFVGGAAGISSLIAVGIAYVADESFRSFLAKTGINSDFRAGLAAIGWTLLCYYGIQKGKKAARLRLTSALQVKKVLEQQLVYRKEKNYE